VRSWEKREDKVGRAESMASMPGEREVSWRAAEVACSEDAGR
jgi:hypothetical protein